jgi:hypothetical protein
MSDDLRPWNLTCPHCQQSIILPTEPLYSLSDAMAALLIPTRGALHTALWRHKDKLSPARYAQDSQHRRYRVLKVSDMQTLRDSKKVSLRGVVRWLVHPV